MSRYEGQVGRTGAWVLVALSCLAGCNAAPETTAAAGPVAASVRSLTQRSASQPDVVTLPSGERLKRVGLRAGYNHVLIGRVDADGKRSLACVDSAPASESFLAPAAQGNAQ